MVTKETVACNLVSIHNLAYQMTLMKQARQAIERDAFPDHLRRFFHDLFQGRKEDYPEWAVDSLRSVGVDLLQ